jgi:alpha-acetolactate decarboxylase
MQLITGIAIITAAVMPLLAVQAIAQEAAPYSLKHYGHYKKMMHMQKTDGVVDLKQATSGSHLYGVGATAHGTGEITIIDGKPWLDYGDDGLGNAKHEIADGEQAVLLVTAQVKTWRGVAIPEDMTATQLHKFILAQASSQGINTNAAFPFMLEGTYFDLDWHIVNGRKHGGGHGSGGIYKKINEHRAEARGTIIGVYSAALQGVFTHPGESWHIHVVFENEGKAGHVDGLSVRKGTTLKLPEGDNHQQAKSNASHNQPVRSDNRQLVKLPAMMQEHMLANMRDHLLALGEMLDALAQGKVDVAGKIAESRLGMSSLEAHGASHMAQFMPEGMRATGTAMHRAASRFVTIARDAELEPGIEAQHKVYSALGDIITNCNACHQAYRIR